LQVDVGGFFLEKIIFFFFNRQGAQKKLGLKNWSVVFYFNIFLVFKRFNVLKKGGKMFCFVLFFVLGYFKL
jgi:hypothetical protein